MAAITTNTMEIGVFWPLLITLIIGLVVSSVKCKNYRDSIKYGLLAGAIVGIIYSLIISLFLIPWHQIVDINTSFSLSSFEFSLIWSSSDEGTGVSLGNVALIISLMATLMYVNIVLGLLGGLMSIPFNKNEVKSTRGRLNKK